MFGLGAQELLVILVIVLIFFGAQKIPELARSLGKGVKEFRTAQEELKKEFAEESSEISGDATCPSCHKQVTDQMLYCGNCGQQLSVKKRCNQCQKELQSDEKFCPNCGRPA